LEALEGFDLVNKYDGVNDFAKLKAIIPNDAEGFVIRFKSGMRMKIKGEEYVRLHRILTNISTTSIWDVLRSGGNFAELLDRVPDEFYKWINETVDRLNGKFSEIENQSKFIFGSIKSQNLSRKEFAALVLSEPNKPYATIVFKILDGKGYKQDIWKMIEKELSVKVFKSDEV
jgi:RNA ligase